MLPGLLPPRSSRGRTSIARRWSRRSPERCAPGRAESSSRCCARTPIWRVARRWQATSREESRREQAEAGLDRLSADEFIRFRDLNSRYRERFGFPFIFAVKGATKDAILAAFEARIDNEANKERWAALANVERIVRFRIEDRVAP